MLLGFKKIGKSKQKFVATVQFVKAINLNTERGFRFKVKFERGSHQVQAISEAVKKGIAKFSPLDYVIPMTLFYEEQGIEGRYLEKQAIIKIYEINESNSQQFKLGTKTIDLAQFADKGQLELQIQFKGENKSDKPSLQLRINIQRQANDTKSNDTSSQNTDKMIEGNKVDLKEVKSETNQIKAQNEKDKKRKKRLYSQQLSKEQLRTNLKKQPASKTAQIDNEQMTKKIDKNNRRSDQKTHINGFSLPKKQSQIQADSNANIFSVKSKKEADETERFKKIGESDKNQGNGKKKEDNQGETQSSQLQIFLLKKSLKDKQSEITSLKRLNDQLRKTIEKIVEQSSTLKQAQKNTGYQKQVEELKKALVTKDIAIDKLTTSNKSLISREEEYEKTIIKLRQQLMISNEKISQMKYRQAFLMQELFETDNKQGLEEASRFLSV